ncbi:hypothetical protein [Limosilactobacillus reuteri]|uniref:hypothetical protein n=1 Tax=Limosilactobacillus reuteri TaxID=1598 RepID=UPI0015E82D69|nr:hypothetical protein [Limosilactobacillus reuteri]
MDSVEKTRLEKDIMSVLKTPAGNKEKLQVIMTIIKGHDNNLLNKVGNQIGVVLDMNK